MGMLDLDSWFPAAPQGGLLGEPGSTSQMISPYDQRMALWQGLASMGAAMSRPGLPAASAIGAGGEGFVRGYQGARQQSLQQMLLGYAAQKQGAEAKARGLASQMFGGPAPGSGMSEGTDGRQVGPTVAAAEQGPPTQNDVLRRMYTDPKMAQIAALDPAYAAGLKSLYSPSVVNQGATVYDPSTGRVLLQGQPRSDFLQTLNANTTLTPEQRQAMIVQELQRQSGDPELAGRTAAAQEWGKLRPQVLQDRLKAKAVQPGGSLATGGTGDLAGMGLLGPMAGLPRVGGGTMGGSASPAAPANGPQQLYQSPVPAPGTPENAFNKTTGEFFGQTYNKLQQGAMDAAAKKGSLDRLEQLMEKVPQGRGAGTINELKAWAKSAGFDLEAFGINDTTPYADAAKSITAQLALGLRNPSGGAGMPGSLSDNDLRFLQSMPPGIERVDGANKLIVDFSRRMIERDQQVARLAREYMKTNNNQLDNGFFDKLQEYSNKNPIFGKGDVEQIAKVTQSASQGGGAPTPGAVVNGYRFKGGDPRQRGNWEAAQ